MTVKKWQLWYDMDIIADNDKYTDLVLKDDDIIFRIQDGKKSEYASIVIQDHEATSPYNMTIRGQHIVSSMECCRNRDSF